MAENTWTIGDGSDEQFAWIEGGEGHNVVCIERLAGKKPDGDLAFVGRSVLHHEAHDHATTDAEWQGMIDLIAAAPEMLTVLKEINRYLDAPHNYTIEGQRGIVRAVAAVLAKAEPVRKVKRKVSVFITVEVEADAGSHTEAIDLHALDNLHVTGVNGVVVTAMTASVVG